jgi:hypothetical protein
MPQQPSPSQDKTWFSAFLIVLGVFVSLVSIGALLSGWSGRVAGILGLALAALLFAIDHILDHLRAIGDRLARLESRFKDTETEGSLSLPTPDVRPAEKSPNLK